jgi:acetyl esterase/lipase
MAAIIATALGCGPALPPTETPAEQGETLAVPDWVSGPGEEAEAPVSAQKRVFEDVVYARVDGRELRLDLFLPAGDASARHPLVIWIHGGGWRSGSRASVSRKSGPLLERGFAVASIDYRLTDQALFPAQIRDCLAAVRFLRAGADEYRLDPDRFGVWGASAGGHLAALVGLAAGIEEFNIGPHAEVSAEVQAVCDWFGPTDLVEMHGQMGLAPAADHRSADSAEGRLVGGPLDREPYGTRALEASPIRYVREGAPPFLIMHGDRDQVIPLEQSASLHRELVDRGVESTFHTVRGAGHGFKVSAKRYRRLVGKVVAFFEKHLMSR